MELHNDEVPGSEVWAVEVTSAGTYDEHKFVHWFITPEASNEEYRDMVAHLKGGAGGTVRRWNVTLPRRRMPLTEVQYWVEDQLLFTGLPGEHTKMLDVFHQEPKREKE